MTAQSGSTLPIDPEADPSATYALDPRVVAGLTRRLVATSGDSVRVESPMTGQPVGYIPQSTTADVQTAYDRARKAQREWVRTPLELREQAALRLHDLILDRQDEIMDLICWESGKARKHAFDEPLHVALTARYYGRMTASTLAMKRRPGVIPGLTRVQVEHPAKGVVGIITPWNYPFTMALCDGLAALMAGNAVVIKPDAQVMLSALLGAELLDSAGFPRELWQVVAGPGSEIGPAVIAEADYMCFTGSTATGRLIAKQCGERLIGCSLELGGKNPLLVLRDADIPRAVEGTIRASFSNAGQLCVSTERIFVAEQIYDTFRRELVRSIEAMNLGAGLDWGIDMGTLISNDQLGRVEAHVADAVSNGAQVLVGGKARPELAPYYFEPTVLEGVTPAMECFAQETFGPVISLYRFHDEADAVARANASDYGLNAAIYSRNVRRARALATQVRCGTVNINEAFAATFASLAAPMGGMGDSGLGRRQGPEGLLRFTETQAVASQRLMRLAPQFGMSDKAYARTMNTSLRVLKKLGRA